MYTTEAACRQAKEQEYLLDPGPKNEFYRVCVSLKNYKKCFGLRINS